MPINKEHEERLLANSHISANNVLISVGKNQPPHWSKHLAFKQKIVASKQHARSNADTSETGRE